MGSGPAACPKFDTAKLGSNATRREIILVDPVFNHQGNRGAGAELAMRVVPTLVTGVLLLVSVNVAKAADPTLLAETAAYLLGNAHRCGVADDRVEHAGRVIRDLMVVAAQDTAELATAQARFVDIFSAVAVASQDQEGFPSCEVVILQFERLARHHRQRGLTD